MIPITRRQALGEMLAGAALLATGCDIGGAVAGRPATGTASETGAGSTLQGTWIDRSGTGILERGPGEPLIARTELGPQRAATGVLATLAHVTDAHVLDASSPARVPFLARVGAPFQSTFRPQETLTMHVLDGAARAVGAFRPDAVIQGGDLIDNVQDNELQQALAVLRGGPVHPGSGRRGYYGVQSIGNPDPFYYRPDIDAPRHPGLLQAAVRPFIGQGLNTPWYPVLGDHDILVAGELTPTARTRALAVGDQALWELPAELILPAGTPLTNGASPDGPPSPALVDNFLAQALAGPKVRVPPDASRRELDPGEVVARLRRSSRMNDNGRERLDYHADIGPHVRLIVLDLARRDGGSGGLVAPGQTEWLASELAKARDRWVLAISHQPLSESEGGDQLLEQLDRHPRVIAALAGHTHRNLIEPRPTAAGGYWLINTASLIDYPQQARTISVLETTDGGVAIKTWMLDHVAPGELGAIARQLSYLDAQGGRPKGFAGTRRDRNVVLYRRR